MQKIHNAWGNPDEATLADARKIQAQTAKSQQLLDAENELRSYEEWAAKNSGKAKQGQNVSRHKELRDKVRKLGGNPDNMGVADDAARAADDVVDDAVDAARNAEKEAEKARQAEKEAEEARKAEEARQAEKEAEEARKAEEAESNVVQGVETASVDDIVKKYPGLKKSQAGGNYRYDNLDTLSESQVADLVDSMRKEGYYSAQVGHDGKALFFSKSKSTVQDAVHNNNILPNSDGSAHMLVDDLDRGVIAPTPKPADVEVVSVSAPTNLRSKASSNFDTYARKVLNNESDGYGFPYSRMSDDEWKTLNASLSDEGLELDRIGDKMWLKRKGGVNKATTPKPADAEVVEVERPGTNNAGVNVGKNVTKLSKTEKLAIAKREGRAGFHGTDANIAETDNIRWSKGSSDIFDGVSIAKQRETAENYAINRLIRNQNPGMGNEHFSYDQANNVLTITYDKPINMANKKFYIYELAADENNWMGGLRNRYAGNFEAYYNKGAAGTEWLAKHEVDLDDLIRSGRVKINAPQKGANVGPTGVRSTPQKIVIDDVEVVSVETPTPKPKSVPDEVQVLDAVSPNELRTKASSSFETHAQRVRTEAGYNPKFPRERMTDEEWRVLNNRLVDEELELVDMGDYMRLQRRGDNIQVGSSSVVQQADGAVVSGQRFLSQNGVYLSEKVYSKGRAEELINAFKSDGYVAIKQGVHGVSEGEEYIVIAVHRNDITRLGAVLDDEGNIIRNLDKSAAWKNVQQMVDSKRILFNDADGMAQIVKVGKRGGRPIVLVRVTKDGNTVDIPFYVSTGTAGKTDVPTGKWEVFGGIGGAGRSNWFVKGTLKDIVNHYNCSQLKKIAVSLDETVGDLRDTELVLQSMGRANRNGQGFVGRVESAYVRELSVDDVNSGIADIRNDVEYEWGVVHIGPIIQNLKKKLNWN